MAAPAHRDRRCSKSIFKNQIPTDDPGNQFPKRGVRIRIGAARDWYHRSELGIAKPRESAGHTR
jgi:hypothetical protein